MAYRIHVTAIRDCTTASVRETYVELLGEGFADVPLLEHNGWISFRSSVWQVASRDLIDGLRQLNKPGLQFTTEDGFRWYVTLCQPENAPVTMIHEFGNHGDSELDEQYFAYDEDEDYVDPELAFLEDEPETQPSPRTSFDRFAGQFAELGAALPKSLFDELAGLPFNAAINRFRIWHQDQLVDFLTEAGAPFDEVDVRRALSWQGLTDVERGSDLGNLPRLLAAIGIGEEWEKYIAEAENMPIATADEIDDDESESELDENQVAPDSTQLLAEVEQVIGSIDATPIEGEPVNLPLVRIEDVAFFAEACQVENEIKALLVIELSENWSQGEFDRLVSTSQAQQIGCVSSSNGFKIGFDNHLLVDWRHLKRQLGVEICQFIEHLPDGSLMTLAFGAEGEPATRQVYRGEIVGQDWRINATNPSLPADVLSDALWLAANAPETSHSLRDATEAEAVMEAVKKDGYLHGMDVQRTGNTISCEYDVEFLAKIIFRSRFGEYWDVQGYERHADEGFRERIRAKWEFLRKTAEQARTQAAPRIGEPIYQGKSSVYWNSNLEHFEELDPEIREKFIGSMEALNFRLLGDLTVKRFRDYAIRFYISPDRCTYSGLSASKFGYLCIDFVTDFSDGSRLSTTTQGMAFSRPAVKLYYRIFSELEAEELYEKHLQQFAKFKDAKGALPVALEPTLEGVARCLDQSLDRTDTDEANFEAEELEEDDEDYEDYLDEDF